MTQRALHAIEAARGWLQLGGEEAHIRAWEELKPLCNRELADPRALLLIGRIRAAAGEAMLRAQAEIDAMPAGS